MSAALPVEDQIVAALRRIIRAVDLHSRRLVEQSGLTGPQWLTLREAARLGRPPAGVLSRAVNLSQATVTGILDRLERRGLVERVRDAEDRRSVAVSVTAEGQRLLSEAPSLLQDRFRLELSRLHEWEQVQVLATLQRIAHMMAADDLEAAPLLVTGSVSAGPADLKGQMPSLAASEALGEEPPTTPPAAGNTDAT